MEDFNKLNERVKEGSFYCSLTKKIIGKILRKESFDIMIKQAIEETGCSNNKTFSLVKDTMKKIFSGYLEELKQNGEDFFYLSDKNEISFYEKEIKRFFKINPIPKKEGEEIVKKPRVIINPRRGVLEKLSKVLSFMIKNGNGNISKKDLISITKMANFAEANLKGWISSLEKIGIHMDSSFITIGKKSFLKINNYQGLFLELNRYINGNRNINLDNDSKVMRVDIKKQPASVTRVNMIQSSSFNSELLYNISLILKYLGGDKKAVEIDVITKNLSKLFSLFMTNKEVLNFVRESFSDYIEICSTNKLKLLNSNSWGEICEKYSPKSQKRRVLCRLTLSEDEIGEFFDFSIKSEISKNDNIVEIEYNLSKVDLEKWTMLYRKFRNVDKILNDDELEEKIKKEILIQNGRYHKDDIIFEMESSILSK